MALKEDPLFYGCVSHIQHIILQKIKHISGIVVTFHKEVKGVRPE
jgi:hypothetical protein